MTNNVTVEIYQKQIGSVMKSVTVNDARDKMMFEDIEGNVLCFYHDRDCCESVAIEDIEGNLNDLVGSPILVAECVTHENENPAGVTVPEYQESFTWTFYRFATERGFVVVRWYGSSNGYYSEQVDVAFRAANTDTWLRQDGNGGYRPAYV